MEALSNQLLYKELILMDYESKDCEGLLKSLASILQEKGYVKDSYIRGVLEREKVFPTGLNQRG